MANFKGPDLFEISRDSRISELEKELGALKASLAEALDVVKAIPSNLFAGGSPSVASILDKNGYTYEAACVRDLITAASGLLKGE